MIRIPAIALLFAVRAYAKDDDIRVGGSAFSGERQLLGADIRIEKGTVFVSGEAIVAALDPDGRPDREPWGYQVSAGKMVKESAQVLLRLDALKPEPADWNNYVVFGFNLWPTNATELQVNYLVPTDAPIGESQLLVNAQVAF